MFNLEFTSSALRFLKKLNDFERERISKKFEVLKRNPELGKPLTGKLSGHWSLRIGKYRAIYRIIKNELIILILKLGKREKVY